MSKKKIAVILSGCGVYDGSEIHEATLSLLAIQQAGAEYEIFAPSIIQHQVVNHLTGETMDQERNVLVESARIARGKISDLATFDGNKFDGILLPGGYGAAKNLSDFAIKGADCDVIPDLVNALNQMYLLAKPIGALCIAPAIVARVIKGATATIGNGAGASETFSKMGAKHFITDKPEIVIDKEHCIVSAPCYMLDANLVDIAESALGVVKAMLDFCR
jgi:enhancing lycopene biosynthesis protein 2